MLRPKALYLIALNIFLNVSWLFSPFWRSHIFLCSTQKWSLTLAIAQSDEFSHCDHSFNAFCQQPSALAFHQMQPGNTLCALTSTVISHGARNVFGKEKKQSRNQGSVTKASLFKHSNCLFKYCHGESQRRMAHLFFPFEFCSWILSGRQSPQQLHSEGGGHGNTSAGGLLNFKILHSVLQYLDVIFVISILQSEIAEGFLTGIRRWCKITTHNDSWIKNVNTWTLWK